MENMPVVQQTQLTVGEVVSQLALKQEIYKKVMIEGTHYGVIPGCPKPSLYKPGAEVLGVTFGLAGSYANICTEKLENGHREVTATCRITNGAGRVIGECSGSCSTLETKYRWRDAQRICPTCVAAAIIRGKKEYGGGWLCFAKKGGCGAKFADGDQAIEGQECGRIENPDIADTYNTVLKMAQKRAYVGAMLSATGASDIFTQDVEDLPEFTARNEQTQPQAAQAQKAAPAQAAQPKAQFTYERTPVKSLYANLDKRGQAAAWKEAVEKYGAKIDAANDIITTMREHPEWAAFIVKPIMEMTDEELEATEHEDQSVKESRAHIKKLAAQAT